MAQIEIRRVEGDEIVKHWLPLVAYAFNETPPINVDEFQEKYQKYYTERYIAVLFDNGVAVATANLIDMTQSVRSKILPMGGVAGVATQPQARRKGYARQLVQHLFERMQQQQMPVSTLYPFRESFYGRLGYVGFAKQRIVSITPATLATATRVSVEGRIEFMHIREAHEKLWAFEDALHPTLHGLGRFSKQMVKMSQEERIDYWVALAWQGETLVGAMTYKLTGFAKEMHVPKFYYANTAGKYLLLNWLGRHVDQVTRVWLRLRPDDYIETWLYDTDTKIHSSAFDVEHPFGGPTPQGRIMMVEQLNGLQVGEGTVVVALQDEQCDWNNGTFRLTGYDGTLNIERTDDVPQVSLTIEALSGLVYGVIDPADFVYRGWGNPSTVIQATLRRMFPRRLPWLDAQF